MALSEADPVLTGGAASVAAIFPAKYVMINGQTRLVIWSSWAGESSPSYLSSLASITANPSISGAFLLQADTGNCDWRVSRPSITASRLSPVLGFAPTLFHRHGEA